MRNRTEVRNRSEVRNRWSSLPTLADRWSPTRNSFGLLRVTLAFGVLFAHTWPVGFGLPSLGYTISSHQSDLGSFSLFGLLLVAGFLNTDSGLRFKLRQYAWRRFLRIFPGLWVCLIVTALVIAPLVALYENGTLAGFWTHHDGPFAYIATNWFASMDQFPISGLLAHTPYGTLVGGPSAFDGSLWSLRYEFGCYVVLGILIAAGVLRRRPKVVLLLTALAYALVLRDVFAASSWTIRPPLNGAIGPFPLIGAFEYNWVLYLGFLFLLGASARLYMHRIPMHGSLAIVAVMLMAVTLWKGGWLPIGLPAYAYLLLYIVVSLPAPFTRLGRRRDYSFGIYIYAFPVQQSVALMGGTRWGIFVYLLICTAVTVALAAASWHLIEHPFLQLKNRRPSTAIRQLAGRVRTRIGRRSKGGAIPEPALSPAPLFAVTATELPVAVSDLRAVPALE